MMNDENNKILFFDNTFNHTQNIENMNGTKIRNHEEKGTEYWIIIFELFIQKQIKDNNHKITLHMNKKIIFILKKWYKRAKHSMTK